MNHIPIRIIKERLNNNELTNEDLDQLRQDSRKGIQTLLRTYDEQQKKKQKLEQNFYKMQQFDFQYCTSNTSLIAGVDEAGRGPLAGPVVVAAVVLPKDFICVGLTDSKQLTEEERLYFFQKIKQEAISYYVSILSNKEIDRLNILQATKQGMKESINNLSSAPEIALIDAETIHLPTIPTVAIHKGDTKSLSIAAASVLAKVTRDEIMDHYSLQYPEYDFKNNKGYPTKAHMEALEKFGPTEIHRNSFAPVQRYAL